METTISPQIQIIISINFKIPSIKCKHNSNNSSSRISRRCQQWTSHRMSHNNQQEALIQMKFTATMLIINSHHILMQLKHKFKMKKRINFGILLNPHFRLCSQEVLELNRIMLHRTQNKKVQIAIIMNLQRNPSWNIFSKNLLQWTQNKRENSRWWYQDNHQKSLIKMSNNNYNSSSNFSNKQSLRRYL